MKIAELDVGRGGATLNSFVMAPTPPHAVSGGDIMDTAALSTIVSSIVQELKTKRKMVCTGLWGSSVIVKKISIPKMDEKVVGEQIRWEAEQYIPFDINEVNLDYKILKSLSSNAETMDILIVAARSDQAGKYVEIVSGASLECAILDVGGFALANCFEINYGIQNKQIVALLNIGASVTNFVILDHGEVVFCRDISVGGLTYSSEIQKSLSVSPEEAESIKLSACSGQEAPEEVPQILRNSHEIVGDELQGSFDFFMNTNGNATISKCYITGGGARVPGLMDHLSQVLKIPCENFDPFAAIKYNAKNISTNYLAEVRDFASVALGLGLRKIGEK